MILSFSRIRDIPVYNTYFSNKTGLINIIVN